jgi:hypothetical protein
MPTMSWRRRLAMELATCRSGRSGGASGSPTLGNGRLRAENFATAFRGGNGAPLGDQEAVGGDAHRGVVVEAAPTSPFEVAEPHLLLEILVVALDAPAHHGDVDQAVEGDVRAAITLMRCSSATWRASTWLAPSRPWATRSAAIPRARLVCSPRRGRVHARAQSASTRVQLSLRAT